MAPDLKKIEQMAEKIHKIIIVMRYYCQQSEDEYEMGNVIPLIDILWKESDNLVCEICGFND